MGGNLKGLFIVFVGSIVVLQLCDLYVACINKTCVFRYLWINKRTQIWIITNNKV